MRVDNKKKNRGWTEYVSLVLDNYLRQKMNIREKVLIGNVENKDKDIEKRKNE